MRKPNENLIIIRHGRIRRTRSLTKGRKVLNLIASGISRSSRPKLRVSRLEWEEKSLKIHNKIEGHFNVGNVEHPTCTKIVHSRMRVQGQLITFKK